MLSDAATAGSTAGSTGGSASGAPPSAEERITSLDAELRARHGHAAPRLCCLPVDGAEPPLSGESEALLRRVVEGLTPLSGLSLHACFPAEDLSAVLSRLTSCGLGRAMGDRRHGQTQYLLDCSDDEVFGELSSLARSGRPAAAALLGVMSAVTSCPAVGSVPGAVDARPVAGAANPRHFWLRLSSGGEAGTPHFNTNSRGAAADGDEERGWHVDNPGAPTRHPTSRLLLKLYASRPGCEHRSELRAPALRLGATAPVAAGDGLLMSHLARGSSSEAAARRLAQHRGRCPPGLWQLELVLNCVCADPAALTHSLRAAAEKLRHAPAVGPTLADGAPLQVDPETFRDRPGGFDAFRRRTLNLSRGDSGGSGDGGPAMVAPGPPVAAPVSVVAGCPITTGTAEPPAPRVVLVGAVEPRLPVAVAVPVPMPFRTY